MVGTDIGAKDIFRVAAQIQLDDIHNQAHGKIENAVATIPIPLTVSSLFHLSCGTQNQAVSIMFSMTIL